MPDSANQHYVPQFYFRGFSENGKSICVLNRSDGSIVPTASIKGQASRKYFYGDAEAEKQLRPIDGAFSAVVKRLRDSPNFDELSPDDYLLLLQNIMLQKSRTLSARSRSKAMQDRLLQLHLESQVLADESLDDETRKAFLEFAARAEANPKQYQAVEMSIALKCVDSLLDLLPLILHNRTARPFIFGDAPVIFTNPHLKHVTLRGVLGAQTPGLMILYPISPTHLVALIDAATYNVRRLTSSILPLRHLADVSILNRLQIQNASAAAYFHSYQYAPYATALWQEERHRLADNKGVAIEAPGFDEWGEPIGGIFHSFERQLPFIPQLSFVEYDELPEKEYRFSTRTLR